ncbi:MAG: biotin--[acetyl-CoA-carboxylase] ligase [Helicobacteraceae bacterium]|nr:biotin--[acetyl-CoA-carboxylase] ligase [Candidatus Sulfurimonas ponti]MBL6973268.1 biotin--[acetyl-CoA-carboxylase] ligase [Sulfurimonas sp.]
MKIIYLESVDSTQTYLKKALLTNKVQAPYAVLAKIQTNGIGSRDNTWTGIDGNLFLSFTLPLSSLPKDLKIESSSIYFAYLLKETLTQEGSSVFLKWPNDFYIDDLKIGGMITNILKDSIVCGVGLNLVSSPKSFGVLDIKISKEELLKKYFTNIEKLVSWKKVFSKYKIEFVHNKKFNTHRKNLTISLEKAILQDDGSIIVDGQRIYSTR